jgi:hypothetical protein
VSKPTAEDMLGSSARRAQRRLNTALGRMKRYFAGLAFVSALLSGCAAVEHERLDFVEYDNGGPVAATEELCVAAQGSWGPAGILGEPMCHFVPTDAGKACTDSTQCESKCVSATRVRYLARVTGVCHDSFLPFGCLQRVHAGKAGQALCID